MLMYKRVWMSMSAFWTLLFRCVRPCTGRHTHRSWTNVTVFLFLQWFNDRVQILNVSRFWFSLLMLDRIDSYEKKVKAHRQDNRITYFLFESRSRISTVRKLHWSTMPQPNTTFEPFWKDTRISSSGNSWLGTTISFDCWKVRVITVSWLKNQSIVLDQSTFSALTWTVKRSIHR